MKIGLFFHRLPKKRAVLTVIVVFAALIACLTVIIKLLPTHYSISKKDAISADLLPDYVKFYFEIKNPRKFLKNLYNRPYGRDILANEAWKRLFAARQFGKFTSLLYLIEISGKAMPDSEDLYAFFDGSAGFGIFPDNTFICIFKVNRKTNFGKMIASSLNGEGGLRGNAKGDEGNNNTHATTEGTKGEDLSDLIVDRHMMLGDVQVSYLALPAGNFYLALLEGFLFMTDSIDTLKASLETGRKNSGSIITLSGGSHFSNVYGDTDALFYINKNIAIINAFSHIFIKGKALGGLLHPADSINIDFFNLGFEIDRQQGQNADNTGGNAVNFEKIIPKDSTASLFVYDKTFDDLLSAIKKSGIPENTAIKFEELYTSLGFGSIRYGRPGFCFVFNRLALNEKLKLTPEFTIAFSPQDGTDSNSPQCEGLARRIFKAGDREQAQYLDISYSVFKAKSADSLYSPAIIYRNGVSFLLSTNTNAMNQISALAGYSPVTADSESYSALKDYYAPCRIVINIKSLLTDIKNFYYFGIENTKGVSKATIDNDILPLFDFLNRYSIINIAFGNSGIINGKAVFFK